MTVNAKATHLAREIADKLKQRQSLTVSESMDSSGRPVIRVGAASAGNAGGLIRVEPQAWPVAVDVLGLAATQYAPLEIRVGFEANPAGGAGADVNSLAVITPILGECLSRGTRVKVYRSANGDNPDEADLDDASLLVYTWDFDPTQGIIGNQ